jgi:Holliday junction resolvase RusA-like endonuclease
MYVYLKLLQNPVPASRPKVSRWSVYFGKKYTAYRDDAPKTIAEAVKLAGVEDLLPLKDTLFVAAIYEVQQPKTTKLQYPNSDIDNYDKSLFDCLTKAGIWVDDKQILASFSMKRWAEKNKKPCTHLMITTHNSSDISPALVAEAKTMLRYMMMDTHSALDVSTGNLPTEL